MSGYVIDSSVLLAVVKGESIDPLASSLLTVGTMSAVNLAEVSTKLHEWGMSHREPWLVALLERVEPFTVGQARSAGELRKRSSAAGLSLGDRACLALALELGAEVYTTDRAWARVDVGCRVNLLR